MNRSVKTLALAGVVLLLAVELSSCGNAPQKNDSKESAEERNDAKFASHPEERDAQYLVDAYSTGLYEVEAAQHAEQKAHRSDVKIIATAIIATHGKLNSSIETLAAKKQISLQKGITQEQLDEIKKCGSKDLHQYDREYIDKLIADHKKAIEMWDGAAKKASDADIRNFFSTTLPDLRHHLEMAMDIKSKIE